MLVIAHRTLQDVNLSQNIINLVQTFGGTFARPQTSPAAEPAAATAARFVVRVVTTDEPIVNGAANAQAPVVGLKCCAHQLQVCAARQL